uniref:Kinesin motor domain-containing protein n=1 Tax=Ciona intestinalis TaxID=7719 RepID=H2XUV4_CIOIN
FDFDHVLPESATQKDAYDVTTHSLVEQVLLGYHACLITYGSASTGKSHSLFGKASSGKYKGLIIRAAETLLHSIEKETVENIKCKLTMSFIQVYNEKFYDILDPSATDNIRFHEFADASPLEGVTEMPVQTVDDVTKQLRRNPNRVRDAGRSHTVFTLHYKKEETDFEKNTIQVTDGRLEFADLVGVNRSTKHSTHDVSGNSANAKANKSLQVFGNVVLTLAESSPQSTPYKDSKLTRLLREALGGNCITRLLVAASPCPNLTHETFCCLQFAQRAMTVVNHPEAHISFKEIPIQMDSQLQIFRMRQKRKKDHLKMIGRKQINKDGTNIVSGEHGSSRSPTPPKEAFSKVIDGRQRNSVPVALRKDERKEAKDRDAKQAKITQLEQLLVKIQNETAPLSEFQALRENKVKDRQRIKIVQEKLLGEQARLEALLEGCKSKMSQMVSLTEVANLQELRRKEVQKKKIEELSKNLQEQTKG